MAWSAGTKGTVRGKAILAPKDQKELDEAKAKGTLAGAWVIMPPPPPRGAGGRFGGRGAGGPGAAGPRTDAAGPSTPRAGIPTENRGLPIPKGDTPQG